ncbi:oxidoreductase [Planctomycetales bacterium]|nr:oxidoreductase [Planctomycetales bacterium]
MKNIRRRTFLQTASALTLGAVCAPAVLADKSPNSKLNIAVVGVGGRGGANIDSMVAETQGSEKLLAFCDVNSKTLAAQSDKFNVEHRYKDYRTMLDEKGKELDAVLVATLDHTHGIIACSVMNLGLHCYCEKPLANSVWETRQMTDFARQKKLCTQTGTQVRSWNGAHYYRGIELIRAGAIGNVSDIADVHIWCQGTYAPKEDPVGSTPVPDELDYGLWLGPTPFRPFHQMWLSFSRYGFWHSGSGWVSGMGPHTIDLAWTALNITPPSAIEIDGPEPHSLYNRDQQHITWTHRHSDGKPLNLHWYDGNRRPEGIASELIDASQQAGVLFVGKEGSLQVHYGYHKLFPAEKFADFRVPQPTYPPSVGHHRQWIEAIKAGKPEMCECRFEYAGPYMEAISVAAQMHRTGTKKATWNPETMTTDSEAVNAHFKPVFRDGWVFPAL